MKYNFFCLLVLSISGFIQAQENQAVSQDIKINEFVEGTLLVPSSGEDVPLVIMLQGSGPTDRNGNQSFAKNDSFKKLAQGLAEKDIASFRYDKRIFQMQKLKITEKDMRFEDFVIDASSAIDFFTDLDEFKTIVVLGHSQGSLVGMIAAKDKADAFISIAGLSRTIDAALVEQIGQQMPNLKESSRIAFEEMRKQGSTNNYNPVLASVFNPSLQPFMLSWMKYNPIEEIQKLDIPVLLINGTEDLQVSPEEAEELFEAKPTAELVILENMNHVLTPIEGDDLENSKSYNEPKRPLHPELVPVIVEFIKGIE